jgi:hypothetical protein
MPAGKATTCQQQQTMGLSATLRGKMTFRNGRVWRANRRSRFFFLPFSASPRVSPSISVRFSLRRYLAWGAGGCDCDCDPGMREVSE